MEWIWLKSFGSLLLILVLIVGTMWALKKFMVFNKPSSGGGIAMEIAGVLHLGPRRSVYAVKAGNQVILLGVAEHAITYLTQLPESAQPGAAGMSTAAAQPLGGVTPFLALLTERFARGVRQPHLAEPAAADPILELPEIPETAKKTKSSGSSRKKAPKPL